MSSFLCHSLALFLLRSLLLLLLLLLFKASVAGRWYSAVGVGAVVVLPMALGFPSPFVGHTLPRLGPHSRRGPWLGRVASRPTWIESMTLLPEVERCARCGAPFSIDFRSLARVFMVSLLLFFFSLLCSLFRSDGLALLCLVFLYLHDPSAPRILSASFASSGLNVLWISSSLLLLSISLLLFSLFLFPFAPVRVWLLSSPLLASLYLLYVSPFWLLSSCPHVFLSFLFPLLIGWSLLLSSLFYLFFSCLFF